MLAGRRSLRVCSLLAVIASLHLAALSEASRRPDVRQSLISLSQAADIFNEKIATALEAAAYGSPSPAESTERDGEGLSRAARDHAAADAGNDTAADGVGDARGVAAPAEESLPAPASGGTGNVTAPSAESEPQGASGSASPSAAEAPTGGASGGPEPHNGTEAGSRSASRSGTALNADASGGEEVGGSGAVNRSLANATAEKASHEGGAGDPGPAANASQVRRSNGTGPSASRSSTLPSDEASRGEEVGHLGAANRSLANATAERASREGGAGDPGLGANASQLRLSNSTGASDSMDLSGNASGARGDVAHHTAPLESFSGIIPTVVSGTSTDETVSAAEPAQTRKMECMSRGESRLQSVLRDIQTPKTEVFFCTQVDLDLGHWAPGLSMAVGVQGSASYTAANGCWGLNLMGAFLVQWGFEVLGHGVGLSGQYMWTAELQESTMATVFSDADRDMDEEKRWFHAYAPEGSDTGRCHSRSPWSLIQAYLEYRLPGMMEKARKRALERRLKAIAQWRRAFDREYRPFTRYVGATSEASAGAVVSKNMNVAAVATLQAARLFLKTLPAYASQALGRLVDNSRSSGTDKICMGMMDILDASCFRLPHSDGRFWGRWPALRQYEHVPFTLSEAGVPALKGQWERFSESGGRRVYRHTVNRDHVMQFYRGKWRLGTKDWLGRLSVMYETPDGSDTTVPPVTGWMAVGETPGPPPEFSDADDERTGLESLGISQEHEDGRVMNFAKALRVSMNTGRKEFYREVSISATNVFVRIVGDVHALFGAVMARDAAWDGTCASLPLKHQLGAALDPAALQRRTWISDRVDAPGRIRFAGQASVAQGQGCTSPLRRSRPPAAPALPRTGHGTPLHAMRRGRRARRPSAGASGGSSAAGSRPQVVVAVPESFYGTWVVTSVKGSPVTNLEDVSLWLRRLNISAEGDAGLADPHILEFPEASNAARLLADMGDMKGIELHPHVWCGLAAIAEKELSRPVVVAFDRACQVVDEDHRPLADGDKVLWDPARELFQVRSETGRPGVLADRFGMPVNRSACEVLRHGDEPRSREQLNALRAHAQTQEWQVRYEAIERRPECERTTLETPFVQTFPTFTRLVQETMKDLDRKLRAVQRCSGGMLSEQVDHVDDTEPPPSSAACTIDRARRDTIDMVRALREFLFRLGAKHPAEFVQAFLDDGDVRIEISEMEGRGMAVYDMAEDFVDRFGIQPNFHTSALATWWKTGEPLLQLGPYTVNHVGDDPEDDRNSVHGENSIRLTGRMWHIWAKNPRRFKAASRYVAPHLVALEPRGFRPPMQIQSQQIMRFLTRVDNFCIPRNAMVGISRSLVTKRSSWSKQEVRMSCSWARFQPGSTWIVVQRCYVPQNEQSKSGRQVLLTIDHDSRLIATGNMPKTHPFGSLVLPMEDSNGLLHIFSAAIAGLSSARLLDAASPHLLNSSSIRNFGQIMATQHLLSIIATATSARTLNLQEAAEGYIDFLANARVVDPTVASAQAFTFTTQLRLVWRIAETFVWPYDEKFRETTTAAKSLDALTPEMLRSGRTSGKKHQFALMSVNRMGKRLPALVPLVGARTYCNLHVTFDVTSLVDAVHKSLCGGTCTDKCTWSKLTGCAAQEETRVCLGNRYNPERS